MAWDFRRAVIWWPATHCTARWMRKLSSIHAPWLLDFVFDTQIGFAKLLDIQEFLYLNALQDFSKSMARKARR